MHTRSLRRLGELRRAEGGYAMIITVMIVMIMSILLTVLLAQSVATNSGSAYEARRDTALGVAESGVNWAVAELASSDRTAVAAAATKASPHQVDTAEGSAWVSITPNTPAAHQYTIEAVGKLANLAGGPTRRVRAVYGPAASFTYALFASSSLTIDNNSCVVGSVFSNGDVTTGNNAVIAGTATIKGSLATNGNITFDGAGNANKCPNTTPDGEAVQTSVGGSFKAIKDDVVAPAGKTITINGATVTGSTDSHVGGTVKRLVSPNSLPPYTFDPQNYAGVLVNYPNWGAPPIGTGAAAPSTTGVASFNSATGGGNHNPAAGNNSGLSGAFVVWQDNPSEATTLDLGSLRVAGDTVIYTNAPVSFGNTQDVNPTPASATPTFVLVSTYAPSGGTCSTSGNSGGACAIWGKNQIAFDPNIAVVLYTSGAMAFKNGCNGGSCDTANAGSYYANTIGVNNNFNITYDPRVANVVGFGSAALQQLKWQELPPCPGGATTC